MINVQIDYSATPQEVEVRREMKKLADDGDIKGYWEGSATYMVRNQPCRNPPRNPNGSTSCN